MWFLDVFGPFLCGGVAFPIQLIEVDMGRASIEPDRISGRADYSLLKADVARILPNIRDLDFYRQFWR